MAGDESSFDKRQIFEAYQARRHSSLSPNESLEKPVFLELLGDVREKVVLDLGCGDAVFGLELLNVGCRSYLGLEASARMATLAEQHLQGTAGRVEQVKIEAWDYPPGRFDLVISRLALHYIADLDKTFTDVHRTLRAGGRFVFSVVHPVITSSDKSREGGGARQDWIVDNYFQTGPRRVYFKGESVEQQHRTIEEIYGALQGAGFEIEALRESRPRRELFADGALYERRKRIPLFLLLAGRKE